MLGSTFLVLTGNGLQNGKKRDMFKRWSKVITFLPTLKRILSYGGLLQTAFLNLPIYPCSQHSIIMDLSRKGSSRLPALLPKEQGHSIPPRKGSYTGILKKLSEFLRYLLSSIKADYKSASESFRIANPKEQPGCSGFVIPN